MGDARGVHADGEDELMIDQMRLSVCAMVSVLVCVGCAQRSKHRDIIIPMPAGADRLAEAIDLTARGERAQEAGDLEAAMEFYSQATRLSADAPAAAWNNLGMIHMQRGEYVGAVAHLRTASELAPLDPQPMYNLGLTFHQAGWDRQALESFIAALEREPNYLEEIRGAVRARTARRDRPAMACDISARATVDGDAAGSIGAVGWQRTRRFLATRRTRRLGDLRDEE